MPLLGHHLLFFALQITISCFLLSSSACLARSSNKPRVVSAPAPVLPVARVAPRSAEQPSDEISCLDEEFNSVPWFVAYKLPRIRTSTLPTFKKGTGYSYILPNSVKWVQSEKGIGDVDSIVGTTLGPFFDNLKSKTLLSLIYNDQPAYRDDFPYNGHAKGLLIGSRTSAVWLMHSTPRFPNVPPLEGSRAHSKTRNPNYYPFYPRSGLTNAQMFLCLTLTPAQLDSIASVFYIVRPHVNNNTLPASLKSTYPNLAKFLATRRFTTSRNPSPELFSLSAGSLDFQLFAKSPRLDLEVYAEWIAPQLKSSLDVQSWLNGQNAYGSNCSGGGAGQNEWDVYNIVDKEVDGEKFGRSDHSKWAVGRDDEKGSRQWTCVSDLNRMEGQKSRGGSTLCTLDSNLWKAFNSAVVDWQPCPIRGKPPPLPRSSGGGGG